jgi:IclR family KDG regulon transcriptional repressor
LYSSISDASGGDAPAGSDSNLRGGIQSIERAFAILEEIARNRDGIALAELSRRVGLHNSTTFHLVKTMVSLGYIQQTSESKRYRVGRNLFTLAAGALHEIELAQVARPVLETLALRSGECSHFAVRSGDDIVVVAKTAGTGMFQVADQVGIVRPAHCTALGKVLLAALHPQQLDRHLQTRELRRFTPRTIIEHDALLREIEAVRRGGIAFDDGEFDPDARCVAVPVHNFTGQVAGAIGISAPMWRLTMQALQEKTQLVREAAAELSRELGFEVKSAAPP